MKNYRHYIRSRWFTVNGLIAYDLDNPVLDRYIGQHACAVLSNSLFQVHFLLYSNKYSKDEILEIYNEDRNKPLDIISLDRYIKATRKKMTSNIPELILESHECHDT